MQLLALVWFKQLIIFAPIASGNIISTNVSEVLERLYGSGVPLPDRHKQAVRLSGFETGVIQEGPKKKVRTDGRGHLWLFAEQALFARNRKEDPQEDADSYMGRIPEDMKLKWQGKTITKADWAPERVDRHTKEFRDFIKSHIPRFDRIGVYEKFYLYIEQASRWLSEGYTVEDFEGEEQRRYATEEMRRIEENRLYGMNKYGWIKDDEMPGGRRKYYASTPQALIIFLLDCGYSLEIGKGRQAAITSTVMLYEAMTMLVRASYKGVLVTDDIEFTGKSIFNDKLKSSIGYVRLDHSWMYPPAAPNWADKKISFDWSGAVTKDEKKTLSSEYALAASDDTQTINGTTPSKVIFDETQNIPTYVAIKLEARPTMLTSGEDGTIRIKRQLCAYGCVCAGTKVWTNDGDLVNIEDLDHSRGIIGFNAFQGRASKEDITYWQPPAEKPCYRIRTRSGRMLECSEDHPILWSHASFGEVSRSDGRLFHKKTKFVEAKDIKAGDQVCLIEEVPMFGVERVWEPRFLGWLVGDGYYGGKSTRLSTCDKEIQDYVYSKFDAKREKGHTTKDGRDYQEIRINSIQQNLRDAGIFGQSKLNKRLPSNIHRATKEDICDFLGGLFDADGCVLYRGEKTSKYIVLTSSVPEIIEDARYLLQKLGIHGRVWCVPPTIKDGRKDRRPYYRLEIAGKLNVLAFHRNIRFHVKYKQERLDFIAKYVEDRGAKHSKEIHGLRMDRVLSVEYIGMKPIYNLTAGTTNTYVANGIVTHNTGSSHQRGKGAFENEYKNTIKKWAEGKDTSSFVPLFLDWTCRPNMTTSRYCEEYEFYLSADNNEVAGMSKEERTAQFHAAMPSKPEDMFLTSHKTIIPAILIKKHQDRIIEKCHGNGLAPMPGHFSPIYDFNKPMPDGSYLPFKVVGAKWNPTGADDFEAPCRMLTEHVPGWAKRFVKGTDPIQSPTGNSKFASVVIDRAGRIQEQNGQTVYNPVVACILNWKSEVVEENFLQSALMNMYYANYGSKGCMEVFEQNQGQAYEQFMISPAIDLERNLWLRMAMPPRYRGGGHLRGLGLKSGAKGGSKGALYADVRSGFLDMGDGVWHYEIFSQAQNVVVEEKDQGGMAYYPRNKNVDNDDLLDAFGFALISSEIEMGLPVEVGGDKAPAKVKKIIYDHDPRTLKLIEREIEMPVKY